MNLPQISTALTALAVSAVLTPVVMFIMSRLGVVDRPDGQRKLHGREVPLAGGLAIWFALIAAVWGGGWIGGPSSPGSDAWFWSSFLVAASLLCVVGLADDAWNLRGRHKLLGQVLAISVLIGGGLVIRGITLFGWQIELGVLAVPFTLFWLLGAINAMNLLDGMDGLASTIGGTIGLAFVCMATMNGRTEEALVAAALVGGIAGFLVYNFPPARVFLGDTGSMLIGLVLGVIAIRASFKGSATIALAAPVAIWTLPILDSSMAILRRKLTGRSIYIGDRAHLHHRLSERGLGPRKSLLLVGVLCLVTTVGAMFSVVLQIEWIAPAVALAVIGFLVVTRLFGHSEMALLARRTRAFAESMVPRRHSTRPREHRSRIQGTREWDRLWESLVTFADRFHLDSVQLSLSLPSIHEQFFAGWDRRSPHESVRIYRAEIPVCCPRFGTIGTLRIIGHCPEESACAWIGDLIDGLRPFETQIGDLLTSEFDARQEVLVRMPVAGSGSTRPAAVQRSTRRLPVPLFAGDSLVVRSGEPSEF